MKNITLEFDSAGGSKSIDFVITGDCGGSIDDMTYSKNLSWATVTSSKTNSDTIRLTITCNGSTTTKLTGSITVSINGDSCSPIQCIQNAPGCNCDDDLKFTYSTLTWTPTEKGDKTNTFSTFTTSCINITDVNVTPTTAANHFNAATASNGIKVTANDYNSNKDAINGTVNVSYTADGQECHKTFAISHQGTNCECGNSYFNINTSALEWENDKSGSNVSQTKGYSVKASCIDEIDYYVEHQSGGFSNHFNISVNQSNGITIYPTQANTSAEAISGTVVITYEANGDACSDTRQFNIIHYGVGCKCQDLTLVYNNVTAHTQNIYWESDEKDERTIAYQIASGKEGCITTVNAELIGDDAYYFLLDKSHLASDKIVKINPIDYNDEPRDIEASINFIYSVNGESCDGVNVVNLTQSMGACDCENLIKNACLLKTVPLSAGTYALGYADTNGCGHFSGSSDSSAVTKVNVTERNNIATFEVTLKEQTSDAASAIEIHFERIVGDTPLGTCDAVYTITQTANYINCDRLKKIVFKPYNVSYSHSDNAGLIRIDTREGIEAFNIFYTNGIISAASFSSNVDWIHDDTFNFDFRESFTYLDGEVDENPDSEPRNAIITMNIDEKVLKSYGICSDCNYQKEFTVTQRGNPAAGCPCPEDYEFKSIPAHGYPSGNYTYPFTNWYNNDCFVEEGDKYTVYDSEGNVISGVYDDYVQVPCGDESWVSIKIEEYTDSTHEGQHRFILYKKIAANGSVDPRDCEIEVKLNFKDTSAEECKPTIKFHQEGKEDITCEDLINSIEIWDSASRIDALGGNNISVAQFDNSLMSGIYLSGSTEDCIGDCSWVTGFSYNSNFLRIGATTNKSTALDGSSSPREAKHLKAFFIDANTGERLKINGQECGEKYFDIAQNGYSGDCPACSSMTNNDLTVNYQGYSATTYTDSTHTTYPAFYGDNSEIDLFEVTVTQNKQVAGNTYCFEIIAETEHIDDFVDGKLYTRLKTGSGLLETTFIVSGKLKPNTTNPYHAIPIAARLYIGKRNMLDGTVVSVTKCDNIEITTTFVLLKQS